ALRQIDDPGDARDEREAERDHGKDAPLHQPADENLQELRHRRSPLRPVACPLTFPSLRDGPLPRPEGRGKNGAAAFPLPIGERDRVRGRATGARQPTPSARGAQPATRIFQKFQARSIWLSMPAVKFFASASLRKVTLPSCMAAA